MLNPSSSGKSVRFENTNDTSINDKISENDFTRSERTSKELLDNIYKMKLDDSQLAEDREFEDDSFSLNQRQYDTRNSAQQNDDTIDQESEDAKNNKLRKLKQMIKNLRYDLELKNKNEIDNKLEKANLEKKNSN